MTVSISPAPSLPDVRYLLLTDPRPGTVVEVAAGSRLAVRFRRPLGASRWQCAELPGHLLRLPIEDLEGGEFQFLVFGCPPGASRVRFERRRPQLDLTHEVCDLLVVPFSDADGRTSRSAWPRTA